LKQYSLPTGIGICGLFRKLSRVVRKIGEVGFSAEEGKNSPTGTQTLLLMEFETSYKGDRLGSFIHRRTIREHGCSGFSDFRGCSDLD
jgi:hypothetical protein